MGKDASPAGVLYFHVHNPIIQTTKMLSLDEIEREMFKRFTLKFDSLFKHSEFEDFIRMKKEEQKTI